MFKKFALSAVLAAIVASTASAAFAAPKHERVPEPLYFKMATGEEG
jgi:hypothetical protein